MPLPLTVSCSSKIQIGFTFLVLAYPDCPGKEAIKWLLFVFVSLFALQWHSVLFKEFDGGCTALSAIKKKTNI